MNELIKNSRCAANVKFEGNSCYPLEVLEEMIKSLSSDDNHNNTLINYLFNNKTKQMKISEVLNNKHVISLKKQNKLLYKTFLVDVLDQVMSTIKIEKMNSKYDKKYKNMKKQYNWLLVPIFKQLRNKYSVSDFFRPHGPTDHKWLSNFDIQDVMKQYELVYPDYKFLGAVPRDFDNFKYWNFSNIDYNNYYDNNNKKTRFGVIFNNDSSGHSGSHWTALFFDMNKSQIYFQDSVGYGPNKEIKTLIKSIEHQMKGDIDNQYSTMDHQHGNSECGVYSLSFILRLLNGESFNDIQSTRLDDNNVNKCRAIYFNNID